MASLNATIRKCAALVCPRCGAGDIPKFQEDLTAQLLHGTETCAASAIFLNYPDSQLTEAYYPIVIKNGNGRYSVKNDAGDLPLAQTFTIVITNINNVPISHVVHACK